MSDGKVIIEADLETGTVDKKLSDLEKKLKSIDKAQEKAMSSFASKRAKLEAQLKDFNEQYENLNLDKYHEEFDKIVSANVNEDYWYNMENQLDFLDLSWEKELKKGDELQYQISHTEGLIEEMAQENKKITEEYEAQKGVLEKQISSLEKMELLETTAGKIKTQIKGVVKQITRWGLAVFGIRSAYFAVRQAMSTLSEYNEQMATDIEYIKYAIANALKPVIEFIINGAYKLLYILGGIIKLITGFNIFSKDTAENFKNIKSSTGAIKKDLAGFDEMNVLGGSDSLGIGSALNNLKDMSKEIDNMSAKIKRWFLGGDSLSEGIQNTIQDAKERILSLLNWLDEKLLQPAKNHIMTLAEELRPVWEPVKESFAQGLEEMKALWQPFIDYINPKVIEPMKNAFKDFKDSTLSIMAPFFNKIIDMINQAFGIFGIHLDRIEIKSGETGDELKNEIGGSLDTIKDKAEQMSGKTYKINIEESPLTKINNWLDEILKKLKDLINGNWNIKTYFSTSASSSTQSSWLDPLRNALSSIGVTLPKFAKGGIINMPGRGVPIGGAIAGERGAEGVIPLTDSQQMALLGEAIGKYITINANITNTMNGRVISRELQKVQNDSDFAFNR